MQLENQFHEKFAQLIFEGKTAVEAYRTTMGEGKAGERTVGSRWFARVDVKARVAELTERAAKGRVLTKRDEMEFLTQVIMTPVGDLTQNSHLCQSYSKDGDKLTVKMPDKMRAIEILAKMKGEFPAVEQLAPPAPPVNVNVNVSNVMSEDRRASLMEKKRAAIQRRLTPANVAHN